LPDLHCFVGEPVTKLLQNSENSELPDSLQIAKTVHKYVVAKTVHKYVVAKTVHKYVVAKTVHKYVVAKTVHK
jgi:hypothetical protein